MRNGGGQNEERRSAGHFCGQAWDVGMALGWCWNDVGMLGIAWNCRHFWNLEVADALTSSEISESEALTRKNSVRHVSLSSLEPTAADRLTHALMHFNICSHHQMLCFLFSYGYIIYGSALIIFKTITKENHLVVPGCSRLFPLLLALLTSGSRRSPGVWWAPSRICSTCSGTPGRTRLGWSHTLWRTEECTE